MTVSWRNNYYEEERKQEGAVLGGNSQESIENENDYKEAGDKQNRNWGSALSRNSPLNEVISLF